MTRTQSELRAEADKLRTAVGEERAARVQEDEKLEALVEDLAAGGLDFEGVGVWWVAVGALLGTFPGELATLLRWPWRWQLAGPGR